jgi:glycosyltransferase involved in cell wall biosynthesis
MTERIHVVEPTLEDEAGHGHSFLGAVMGAAPDQPFEVWAGSHASNLFADLPQVELHPHFRRRTRKLQALWLYRRLLREPGRVFVPTAGALDLAMVDLASSGEIPQGKASFFFHWIRPTTSKRRRLSRAARRQPQLTVLGATEEIVHTLKEAGFSRAAFVPYPVSTSARPPAEAPAFGHLLFAGAARSDKGFDKVVDLVELLAKREEEIPLSVQTSARHYAKHDAAIASDVDRLMALEYPGLRVHPQTLEGDAYFRLFHGAICLQPYSREEFAGRVSAVTVDALASGAPIITTAGTWMGDRVEQLEAGVALADLSADALFSAVRRVIADYEHYSENARKAAEAIQEEHSGAHMLRAVLS